MALLDQGGHDGPVRPAVEPDADPAPWPHIGRYEESPRVRLHQCRLRVRRRIAPEGETAIAVMVVDEHHEDAVAHAEGRRSPGLLLLRLGQGQTHLPDPSQRPPRPTGQASPTPPSG